jgi:hypothetical protein
MNEEKPRPSIEDMLIDKAIMLRALTLGVLKETADDESALRFVESVIVNVRRKHNQHVAHHSTKYEHTCAFCVDAIYTTNQQAEKQEEEKQK